MSSGRKRSSLDPLRPAAPPAPVAFALLVVTAAVLPFETPLLALGRLTITSAELAMYMALLSWGAGIAVRAALRVARARSTIRREWATCRAHVADASREPISQAVAVWIAITLLAGLAAPAQRVPALKFALRALGGGLLFWCARDLVGGSAARIRTVAMAILAGALLSAAGAIAEAVVPNSATLWRAFRAGSFTVTGLPRPSGPFAYPTIAAMYWEAALPLALAIPFAGKGTSGDGGATARVALAMAGSVLLILAILASATRTALAVATLGSLGIAAVAWQRGRALRVASIGTLALAVVLAGTTAGRNATSELRTRLRFWQDGAWYRARYHLVEPARGGYLVVAAGSRADFVVEVQNTGELAWPHEGNDAVRLSYHFEHTDARGPHLQFEGLRSPLLADVAPGATARIAALVQAPDVPGRYRLRWDLLREGVTWFSAQGNPTGDQEVKVVAGAAPPRADAPRPATVDGSLETWVRTDSATRPELWRAAVRLWRRDPLLGVGPDNFRRLYASVMPQEPGRPPRDYDQRLHANSLYFETLADMGLAGLAGLALLIVATWRAGLRRVVGKAPLLDVACVLAAGAFFVHGLLDCFVAFTPTYGLMYLLLALVSAREPARRTRPG